MLLNSDKENETNVNAVVLTDDELEQVTGGNTLDLVDDILGPDAAKIKEQNAATDEDPNNLM